jgi:hypothetical protein
MNLPEEELCFFFWAVQQLAPAVRQEFVDRVVQTLGAHRDPGPGDFDRAIREGILGLWIPPAIEEVRGVTRWDQAKPKFDRVSKMAQPVEEQRRRRLKPGFGYAPAP